MAPVYTAFGATTTGNVNQTVVNQLGFSPIWSGIPNPLNLALDGTINTSTIGLRAAAGGQAIGRFGNGDDALIVGNTGHTLLNGFMPYLAVDVPSRTQLAQNEVSFILGGIAVDDYYAVTVAEGDSLHFVTTTPGDGPGGFGNTLSPHIRLYDPDGNVVAEGVKLPDGRNETLDYTALASGAYRIQVTAENGTRGEYFLDPIEIPAINSPSSAAAPIVLPVARRALGFEVSGARDPLTIQPLAVLPTTTSAVGTQTGGLGSESAANGGQLAASVFISTTAAASVASPAGARVSISSSTGAVQSGLAPTHRWMQTDSGAANPVRFSRQDRMESWNGQALREALPLFQAGSLAIAATLEGPASDGVFADQLWSTDDAPSSAFTGIGTSSDEGALALLAVLVGSYSVAETPEPDRRKRKLLPG
jgi:hypothetical protein